MLALLALLVVSVPLTGGRLVGLGRVSIRRPSLLYGALGVQIVVIEVVHAWAPPSLLAAAHVASYLLAGAFLVANRAVPGLWLVGLGGLANLAAIAANGGVMPASPAAAARAGLVTGGVTGEAFANSAPIAGARLAFLGDVFAVPAGLPLANVFSVGDVAILVGAGWLLHRLGRSHPEPAPEPATA